MRRQTRAQREAQAERAVKRDSLMHALEGALVLAKPGIVFLATQEELAGASTRWRDALKLIEAVLKELQ